MQWCHTLGCIAVETEEDGKTVKELCSLHGVMDLAGKGWEIRVISRN